ncbi:uncharacterized protein Fot_15992 [Forsythia ovata]|uniref:Ribosomal protein L34Ae n=1 Tax=Forsythia ovata TaxID=205694 RepID=A0ABD1WAR3_9LAMI
MKLFVFKTHFSHVEKSFMSESVHRTMFRFGYSFLISVYGSMLKIFWFIAKYVCRSKGENGSSFKANRSQSDDQVVSKRSRDFETNRLAEKRNLELSESQKSTHSKEYNAETEGSVSLQSAIVANTSKYQFISGKNVSGFIEEAKTMKFEMFVGSNEDFVCTNQCLDSEFSQKRDSLEVNSQENLQQLDEEIQEEKGKVDSAEYENLGDEGIVSMEDESMEDQDFSYEIELLPENQFSAPEIKQDSEDPRNDYELLPENQSSAPEIKQDSEDPGNESELLTGNQFSLPEIKQDSEDPGSGSEWFPGIQFSAPVIKQESEDPGNEDEVFTGNQFSASDMKQDSDATENEVELLQEFLVRTQKVVESGNNAFLHGHDPRIAVDIGTSETVEECHIGAKGFAIRSSVVSSKSVEDSDDEYIEFEPPMVNSKDIDKESLYHKKSNKMEESHEVESTRNEVMVLVDNSQEEASNRKSWDSDSEDEDECDILLEHQHLVQQMKMELKSSRIRGLPTISEECETPKMVEDLKPLKIDHKFEYKDIMDEIQKFYKSYKERMRKLDILNYQTLHAISFLQLKDSEVFTSVKKKSALTLKPTWPMKVRRVYVDPTLKSVVEMHRDLELVYVGQLCLSWEILCWQYVKAKELLEYDAQGFHSYNRVAEEFQQFQVLMQRFMEDEPFQGPRIQNYVKNRCMIQSLLQVPIIKDDCLDKKERREETDAISLELLAEIIKGSMVIFWEFLHADKSTKTVFLKGVQGAKIDLQEPTNSELMMDIITNLQKKERGLKEIVRSQNCIVKKFRRHQECQLNNSLFTSRVELGLVSRVLSLSRLTTDQLVWCQKKLNNINFANRKVHMEPSFSLFPC